MARNEIIITIDSELGEAIRRTEKRFNFIIKELEHIKNKSKHIGNYHVIKGDVFAELIEKLKLSGDEIET